MIVKIRSVDEFNSIYTIGLLSNDIAYNDEHSLILISDPYVYHVLIDETNIDKFAKILKFNLIDYYSKVVLHTDDIEKIKLLEKYL